MVVSCPELTEQLDPSFGATVRKLVEVANQYRICREAALNGRSQPSSRSETP